ncbi:dipeptidase [Psychromonas sp. SP041]|uniref:dipeptidase n=1 Tax=Psychromonas sp. SP041 TaxID=1365007 RepID=UPI0010C795B7|nr:dipeptidase [Psychromonas sp. SP041]
MKINYFKPSVRVIFYMIIAIVLVAIFIFMLFGSEIAANKMNPQPTSQQIPVSEKVKIFHDNIFVADLHADSLLWGRNLLESTKGHVDLPKLISGGVDLQVFSAVTKTPSGINIESNSDKTDNILYMALAQQWPIETWKSLFARAEYQANRLKWFIKGSQGKLKLIGTKKDLHNLIEKPISEPHVTGVILSIEGAHALEGNLTNLKRLYDIGYRMISPSHFFDTEIGGSIHGELKYGLTELGVEWVTEMESRGMAIDLSHASSKTMDDILSLATRPVIVSHTGVKGTCDNQRNLSDEHIRKVAGSGGLIGIGFWPTAVCGSEISDIVRAIKYVIELVGVDYVALGSDFDGAVSVIIDAGRLPELTQALITEGISDTDIEKIMGGNVAQFFLKSLPKESIEQ